MVISYILLENSETTQEQIKQLRDLIIDFHYSSTPWYKENMSAIIALCTLVVAFFTQQYIFKKTAKKELKKDIAKLYAEFSFYSKEYSIQFFENNHSILQSENMARLKKHYVELLSQPTDGETLVKIRANIVYYESCLADSMPLYEKNKNRFRELKFNSVKPLFELQFLLGTEQLEGLIKSYEQVKIYTYENDEIISKEKLEEKKYLSNLMDGKVTPRKDQIDNLIIKIQNEIKGYKF